jgi:hypothetical protein
MDHAQFRASRLFRLALSSSRHSGLSFDTRPSMAIAVCSTGDWHLQLDTFVSVCSFSMVSSPAYCASSDPELKGRRVEHTT